MKELNKQLLSPKERQFENWTPYQGAVVTRNKTFPIDVFKGGRNLIKNSGVTKQFTEQVPKPQINSDFDLEQELTWECYKNKKWSEM